MLKVIGSRLCPDTAAALEKLGKDGVAFDFVDILENHDNLKVYLKLRDSHPLYENIRGTDGIGIPAFVKEDGSVTLNMDEI